MIKIVLADDHPVVLDGLATIVGTIPNVEVVGTTSNGEEALKLVHEHKPDILITDISMSGISGIDLIKKLTSSEPCVKCIILSMHDSENYINKALQAGAMGYLLKDTKSDEMRTAIEKVYSGEKYLSESVTKVLMNSLVNKSEQQVKLLSAREKEILQYVVLGMQNKEIGQKLHISTRTVDVHRYNIMQKLDAKNIVELVKKAIQIKLIDIN